MHNNYNILEINRIHHNHNNKNNNKMYLHNKDKIIINNKILKIDQIHNNYTILEINQKHNNYKNNRYQCIINNILKIN